MSRTNPQLTPLAARKQLLLVESALNRAQLVNDCAAFTTHFDGWKQELHSLTSSITALYHGAQAMQGALARGKSSLLSTFVNVARLGLSLWGNFIARLR